MAKLEEIAKKAAAGKLELSVSRRGRPRSSGAARGNPRSVAVAGQAPLLYANQVSVLRGGAEAFVRFALVWPGEKARAVVDVVVPGGAVRGLGGP